jgi:signal transduction histidine kinase
VSREQGLAEIVETADDSRLTGISQPSFRLLIENTADGILVVDLAGAVLYANPAAARILGHSREALLHVPLGRPISRSETAEITVHRPGDRPAEVEMRVVEMAWDGKPALLASLRDISARRVQEERQRQSQKLEAVGRLAAGIVHDFNNLISVFESGLRLLERQLAKDPADPKIATLIEELLKRTQNGSALTQQLLAFSRRQPLSPQATDLNERIRSLKSLLERTLGGGVQVRLDLDPRLGRPVLIDPNQLDTAILNLAVNARDAMAGRGVLTIETSEDVSDHVEELDGSAASFARITVRDTGCGMSKEILAQVFEPFFTTKGEGTGLGLSQVYGFVRQSGGHVHIDSEVGKGTSIDLVLPCVPADDGGH